MHFLWDDLYGLGFEDIDKQHKHYFEICNKLDDFLGKNTNKDEQILVILFDELLNYALYHFSTEEEYFMKCKYEEASTHVALHNQYRDKMTYYRQKIREPNINKLKLGKEVHEFAVSWLMEHIVKADRRYVSSLKKCLSSD